MSFVTLAFFVSSNKNIAYSAGAAHSWAQRAASVSSGGRSDRVWRSKFSPAFWGPVHVEERQVGSIRYFQRSNGSVVFLKVILKKFLFTGQFFEQISSD